MTDKIKILLVDDHQIVIDGMTAIIETDDAIEVIGQVNDGKAAMDFVRLFQPDLVLLDLDMPVMNGIIAGQEIKKIHPNTKVIILSLHAEKSVIQHMIKAGVDGYLFKNSDQSEVLNAIKAVASGKKYFSPDVTIALSRNGTKTASKIITTSNELKEKVSLLSPREIEVLQLIAEGFSNKEIGEQLQLSYRTIDAHRANLMKKLAIHKVTGLVRFAVKTGLIS